MTESQLGESLGVSAALGNLAGCVVLAVNFLIPLMAEDARRDRRVALVFWLSVLLRQSLALTTGFITGPISDADWFHDWAIVRMREGGIGGLALTVGSGFYERLIGAAYDLLGASPFLAAELSVLAFSASMVVFLAIARELGVTRYKAGLLALYALPFSALFFTSTIIREAYQVLGLELAVLFALRFRRTGSALAMVIACASALFMGLMHDALLLFAGLFLPLAILWPSGTPAGAPQARRVHPISRLLVRYSVLLLLVLGGARLITRGVGSMALGAIVSKQALEYAARHREIGATIEARTTYGLRIDPSSPGAFAVSLVPIFVYYMFAPFPWQIRTPVDVLGGSEALLRFLLLGFAVREWRRSSGGDRRTRTFLLFAYLALAGIWALGTINYGTAYRHHITTNWMLVVLAGPALFDAALRLRRRLFWSGSGVRPRLASG